MGRTDCWSCVVEIGFFFNPSEGEKDILIPRLVYTSFPISFFLSLYFMWKDFKTCRSHTRYAATAGHSCLLAQVAVSHNRERWEARTDPKVSFDAYRQIFAALDSLTIKAECISYRKSTSWLLLCWFCFVLFCFNKMYGLLLLSLSSRTMTHN